MKEDGFFMGEWIWYPGDFEIWLSNRVNTRRIEKGIPVPPFWRMDTCYPLVLFKKEFVATQNDVIRISAEGSFNVRVNEKYVYDARESFCIGRGKNVVEILVYNPTGLPALRLDGRELQTDGSFLVGCQDTKFVPAGSNRKLLGDLSPGNFRLPTRRVFPVQKISAGGRTVFDFGKEMMAYLVFEARGKTATAVYGETVEEALEPDEAEVFETAAVVGGKFRSECSRAFRFVSVTGAYDGDSLCADEEYLEQPLFNSFTCGDMMLNRIFEVAMHTFDLCGREFFLDGIKRDRWIWGGDFYQSVLMNFYSFNNEDLARRTFRAIFGKPPVTHHINHIMDYSFLVLIGLHEYYTATQDADFIREIYPHASALLDFCISRANAEGLMQEKPGDWIFIDWANLDNSGTACAEQILYSASLQRMAEIADVCEKEEDGARYLRLHRAATQSLEVFWNEDRGGFIHSVGGHKPCSPVLKHANILAVLFDAVDENRRERILHNVLLNPEIPQIVTPYFKFFELAALCKCGKKEEVFTQIKSYWGGMIAQGATSFWELYDPGETAHYQMYGRKYGKSLCHAWGAAPLYLLGRYFLGVEFSGGKVFIQPELEFFGDFRAVIHFCGEEIVLCRSGGVFGIYAEECVKDKIVSRYPVFPLEKVKAV